MRALLLERPGSLDDAPDSTVEPPLRFAALRTPEPGPGQLRLRVTACAVCRTDVQLVTGELGAHRLPVVPGHQVVGLVEAVGPGVTDWSVGQRGGAFWLAWACGVCDLCRRGQENLCRRGEFTGWDRDGGFAEQLLTEAAFTLPLPVGFSDLAAAPLLCGGVIGYRALRVAGVTPGSRLGLFGFGASARLVLQVARHWGCEVFVAARGEADRRQALAMGAAWAGSLDERPPVALQAAITTAPVGQAIVAALDALDRGGTVAVNAIHLDAVPSFPYASLWWERSVRSVANVTRADAREFLALAAAIPIRTEVEAFHLADGADALRRVAEGTVEGTPVLLPEAPAG
ncbi:MAG: zinc-dependent alcohol dehydrogenase family protein [Candidatus Limnocylindrales bacterium]